MAYANRFANLLAILAAKIEQDAGHQITVDWGLKQRVYVLTGFVEEHRATLDTIIQFEIPTSSQFRKASPVSRCKSGVRSEYAHFCSVLCWQIVYLYNVMSCKHSILILLFILISGCGATDDINRLEQRAGLYYEIGDDKPFSGNIDSDYANSSIYGRSYNAIVITRGKIIEGKKEGVWYEWYARGKLFFTGEFVNGLPEGMHNWWHINGKIMAQGPYLHGKRHGVYKTWYDNGNKKLILNYDEDELSGEQLKWDQNGMLALREIYERGRLRCRQLFDNESEPVEETGVCH